MAYFWRHPQRDTWRHVLAPGLAGVSLLAALGIAVANFDTLSGGAHPAANLLPLAIAVAMAAGMLHALWLKRRRPQHYAALARD